MTKRTPESLAGRALLALAGVGDMTPQEFTRRVKSVCKNESEISRAASELHARGLIDRRVTLSTKGLEVIEQLKGQQ